MLNPLSRTSTRCERLKDACNAFTSTHDRSASSATQRTPHPSAPPMMRAPEARRASTRSSFSIDPASRWVPASPSASAAGDAPHAHYSYQYSTSARQNHAPPRRRARTRVHFRYPLPPRQDGVPSPVIAIRRGTLDGVRGLVRNDNRPDVAGLHPHLPERLCIPPAPGYGDSSFPGAHRAARRRRRRGVLVKGDCK